MKKLFLLLLLALTAYSPWALAQSVTLANDGVYVSRMNTSQRNAITIPTEGQLIYNTDDGCFNVYQQEVWKVLCGTEATDRWKKNWDFEGTARTSAIGFSIGVKGYIGTGSDGSVRLKDFWEYDQATDSWNQKADFGGVARQGAVSFSIGTKGYVGTGYDGTVRLNDFWEYDPESNGWTSKKAFVGVPRQGAVGFSIGTKGYVGTGSAGTNFFKDFWEYDQATDSWNQKADFGGTARDEAVGFAIGFKGYIGTGISNKTIKDDFWEYDPSKNKWTQKNSPKGMARTGAVGFVINDRGCIAAGHSGSEYRIDCNCYDQTLNQWIKSSFSVPPRTSAVGFSIGNKGYIGTGNVGSMFFNDFWEYNSGLLHISSIMLPMAVTQLGNNFNGANQLLQLDGTGKLPTATLPVSTLPTTVTQQGNSFNGANQLLKLNANAKLASILRIGLGVDTAYSAYYYMHISGSAYTTNPNGNTTKYSLITDGRIAAPEFNAYSDARIKTVIGRSDSEKDLQLLQQLRITDYVYKDKLRYGNNTYKKVVAQEVEAVYPQAVSRKTDFIPDIYQKAKSRLLSASVMELVLDTVSVWQAGQKLKLISTKGEEIIAEVAESGQGNRVRVKCTPAGDSEWFVYGRQVDDFRAVDYEALSMLHLSATQQLLRKIQVLEKEIQAIEELRKEARRISQLEQDNQWMKEQLQLIRNQLRPSSSPQITAEAKP